MRDVKDLSKTEFINLIDSGKFRVKTLLELISEGWEEDEGELFNDEEDVSIEIDSLELLDKLTSSDYIDEIDNKTFRIGYYWFPMSIIDYSNFILEPIELNIPDVDEFLNI